MDVLCREPFAGERGEQGLKLLVCDLGVRTAEVKRRKQTALLAHEFTLVEHVFPAVVTGDAPVHPLEFRDDAPLDRQ